MAPCRQVHTWGMGYPIDVVHLDAEDRILEIQTLRPWRLGLYRRQARAVLELAAGEAGRLGLQVGSRPRLLKSATPC